MIAACDRSSPRWVGARIARRWSRTRPQQRPPTHQRRRSWRRSRGCANVRSPDATRASARGMTTLALAKDWTSAPNARNFMSTATACIGIIPSVATCNMRHGPPSVMCATRRIALNASHAWHAPNALAASACRASRIRQSWIAITRAAMETAAATAIWCCWHRRSRIARASVGRDRNHTASNKVRANPDGFQRHPLHRHV